jgi:hypothetical protein
MARRAPLVILLLALAVLVVAHPGATAPPPAPPDPSCSPGPSNCFAWHTGNVTVSWAAPPAGVTATGCGATTISSDTGGTPVSCTWSNAEGARTTTTNVRRDASPPRVTASADRGPDNNDWYNHGLTITFSGSDDVSGIASCTTASYSGPDTEHTAVPGSCSDHAGNSSSTGFELKYDATPPTVEAKPEREPDSNGWYNHGVTVAFLGTDTMSGVGSCAAPIQYTGPDAPKVSLTGTCKDKAANTSPPANFDLRYDTKPPALGRLKAEITNRGVVLRWTASKDTNAITVVRRPGMSGRKLSTLYNGKARTFTDRRLKIGVKYRYTITAYDEAGNAAVKGLAVKPSLSTTKPAATKPSATKPALTRPALTKPTAGARVTLPPLLAWRPVAKATYYNVQLYRNGQKILSIWPRTTSFHLQRSWRFDGRPYELTPGSYTWYVWPGFGARSVNRYGKLLGTRSFVVVR